MDIIEKIYNEPEYYDIVRNTILFATRYRISDIDLEDCISEVYLTAVKKRKHLEKHPQIKGWLVVTAQYIAKRHIRVKAVENRVFSSIDVDLMSVDPFCGEIEEYEQIDELLSILSKDLKTSELKLFKMKFMENKKNNEVAAVIGCKKNAAEVRITRLKEKIKKILKKT
jgi:RNA polymerase sigma-70 factor (ECF subfamily)